MDNGTEFKNDLFSRVAKELKVERKIYSLPHRPQSNGYIDGFHKLLKSCLVKHITRHREQDDVVPIATTSYNWLPNHPLKRIAILHNVWQRCIDKPVTPHQAKPQVHG